MNIESEMVPEGEGREVTLLEGLELAVSLQQTGRLAEAEAIYKAALRTEPDQPDALHFYGLLHYQRGDSRGAVELLRKAIAAAPENAGAHNNLGNVLHSKGRLEEAAAAYRRVIELAPENAGAHNNLGVTLKAAGRLGEALAAFQTVTGLVPENADAHLNLGNALGALDRHEEAEAAYRHALKLSPEHANAHYNLGLCLEVQGRAENAAAEFRRSIELGAESADAHISVAEDLFHSGLVDDALAGYRRALTLKPDHPAALSGCARILKREGKDEEALRMLDRLLEAAPDHAIARHLEPAWRGGEPHPRASDGFLRGVFGGMAKGFDEHLGRLEYRAPADVCAAVIDHLGARTGLDVLDAGCGTGLCGPLLRPVAGRLVGVDLVARMLEQAAARGDYDELIRAELTAFLEEVSAGSYDVVVSTDTLIYFGALEDLLAGMARALRRNGVLAVSVEEAGDEEGRTFLLGSHGRYLHTEPYVRRCVADAGLEVASLTREVLRLEGGDPCGGFYLLATKAGDERPLST